MSNHHMNFFCLKTAFKNRNILDSIFADNPNNTSLSQNNDIELATV